MTTKNKPQYKTEKVVLDNGTTVNVCRVRMADMELYMEIQERLLEKYVDADGSLCALLLDKEVQADLSTLCSILPLADKSKTGEDQYLNFEELQENWEQLIILFFNGSLNENTREIEGLAPSKISRLHFFPYLETARKLLMKKAEQEGMLKAEKDD